jgi:hypothetical protein
VAASRELLRKHADRLDHDTRIEAHVCPEIEWETAETDGDAETQDRPL